MDEKVAKCLGGLEAKVREDDDVATRHLLNIYFRLFFKGSLVADAKMLAFRTNIGK